MSGRLPPGAEATPWPSQHPRRLLSLAGGPSLRDHSRQRDPLSVPLPHSHGTVSRSPSWLPLCSGMRTLVVTLGAWVTQVVSHLKVLASVTPAEGFCPVRGLNHRPRHRTWASEASRWAVAGVPPAPELRCLNLGYCAMFLAPFLRVLSSSCGHPDFPVGETRPRAMEGPLGIRAPALGHPRALPPSSSPAHRVLRLSGLWLRRLWVPGPGFALWRLKGEL